MNAQIDTNTPGDVKVEQAKRPPLRETADDISLGDNAWFDFRQALNDAWERTMARGCRQQVRAEGVSAIGDTLWLVQDVR